MLETLQHPCEELSQQSSLLRVTDARTGEERNLPKLPVFQHATICNDTVGILYAGGHISALNFHPTFPSLCALSAHRADDSTHNILKCYKGRAHIQLWNLSLLPNTTRCAGVIPHNGNCTWDLKWRPITQPSTSAAPNQPFGTFAAALGDGTAIVCTFEQCDLPDLSQLDDKSVMTLAPKTMTLRAHKKTHQRCPVRVAEWSPDGSKLVLGIANGTVEVYETSSKEQVWPRWSIPAQESLITGVRWMDSCYLCSVSMSCVLRLRDMRNPVSSLEQNAESLSGCMALDAVEPSVAVVGTDNGTLRVVRLAAIDGMAVKQPVKRIYLETNTIRDIQSVPGGGIPGREVVPFTLLYAGGSEGVVHECVLPRPIWPHPDVCHLPRTETQQKLKWSLYTPKDGESAEDDDEERLCLQIGDKRAQVSASEPAKPKRRSRAAGRDALDLQNHPPKTVLFGKDLVRKTMITKIALSEALDLIAVGMDDGFLTWLPMKGGEVKKPFIPKSTGPRPGHRRNAVKKEKVPGRKRGRPRKNPLPIVQPPSKSDDEYPDDDEDDDVVVVDDHEDEITKRGNEDVVMKTEVADGEDAGADSEDAIKKVDKKESIGANRKRRRARAGIDEQSGSKKAHKDNAKMEKVEKSEGEEHRAMGITQAVTTAAGENADVSTEGIQSQTITGQPSGIEKPAEDNPEGQRASGEIPPTGTEGEVVVVKRKRGRPRKNTTKTITKENGDASGVGKAVQARRGRPASTRPMRSKGVKKGSGTGGSSQCVLLKLRVREHRVDDEQVVKPQSVQVKVDEAKHLILLKLRLRPATPPESGLPPAAVASPTATAAGRAPDAPAKVEVIASATPDAQHIAEEEAAASKVQAAATPSPSPSARPPPKGRAATALPAPNSQPLFEVQKAAVSPPASSIQPSFDEPAAATTPPQNSKHPLEDHTDHVSTANAAVEEDEATAEIQASVPTPDAPRTVSTQALAQGRKTKGKPLAGALAHGETPAQGRDDVAVCVSDRNGTGTTPMVANNDTGNQGSGRSNEVAGDGKCVQAKEEVDGVVETTAANAQAMSIPLRLRLKRNVERRQGGLQKGRAGSKRQKRGGRNAEQKNRTQNVVDVEKDVENDDIDKVSKASELDMGISEANVMQLAKGNGSGQRTDNERLVETRGKLKRAIGCMSDQVQEDEDLPDVRVKKTRHASSVSDAGRQDGGHQDDGMDIDAKAEEAESPSTPKRQRPSRTRKPSWRLRQ